MAFYFPEHWLGPQCCLKPVPGINASLFKLKSPKRNCHLLSLKETLFSSLFELQVCHYWMLCWEVYKGQPWTPANAPSWSLAEFIQTSVSLRCIPQYAWLWEDVWPARSQLAWSWAHSSGSTPAQSICLLQMSCPSKQNSCTPVTVISTKVPAQTHCKPNQRWITETTVTQHFISTPYCHMFLTYTSLKRTGFRLHYGI